MTAVKLCGLTKKEEIAVVNHLLPEYIGFVFWEKSHRYVKPEKAKKLKENLNNQIKAVGVFVDAPVEQVVDLFSRGIIDMVQLHGSEDQEYIRQLRKNKIPVIKACRVTERGIDTKVLDSEADYLLFDPGKGEGKTFGWDCIKQVKRPYFLAGGLNPENVKAAIETLHPYGVDVSSGIETDRKKDVRKMTDFVQAVRKEG